MNGRAWKMWYKQKPRPDKDFERHVKAENTWLKPVFRALKFAKKARKEMKRADENCECGLWYDEHDGFGYREKCRAGWLCKGHDSMRCPFNLVNMLIASLEGEAE